MNVDVVEVVVDVIVVMCVDVDVVCVDVNVVRVIVDVVRVIVNVIDSDSDASSVSDSSSTSSEGGMTLNELMERNRVTGGKRKRERDPPTSSENEFVLPDEQPVQTFSRDCKFLLMSLIR